MYVGRFQESVQGVPAVIKGEQALATPAPLPSLPPVANVAAADVPTPTASTGQFLQAFEFMPLS